MTEQLPPAPANPAAPSHTFQYSLMGEKWPGSPPAITWCFAESNSHDRSLLSSYADYPLFEFAFDTNQKSLVRRAFQAWEDVANLDLVERTDSTLANIRIGWDSIDGPSYSGRGAILGQTTVWTADNSTALSRAAIQMDLGDKSDAFFGLGAPPHGEWSFYATVAHEVGHALGLDHAASSAALMYPYAGDVTDLSADDIAGVVALYGQHRQTAASKPVVQGPVRQGVDTGSYLTANPDVKAAGLDPLAHFMNFGWKEGRNPNAFFDVRFYQTANSDVSAAGINPLAHYLQFGWREHRDPSNLFSTDGYLAANPDVKLAGINPLQHYLDFGFAEGRALL